MESIATPAAFWALVLVLVCVAAAVLAVPLLRRRPVATAAPAADGWRLARSRGLALALALLLPAAAVGLYLLVGDPGAVAEEAAAEQAQAHGMADLEEAIRTQIAHLAEDPKDAAGWATLGMTYAGIGRWPEAERALAEAYALAPKEAFIVSAYAEALAVQAGRDLSGRPMELVREALELSTQDEKALELAAVYAYQSGEYAQAAYYFRQLLKVLPEDSPYAADIRAAMREAKGRAEEAAFGPPLDTRPADAGGEGAAPAATISGQVELAPDLAGRITGKESLFLVARPVSGGGTPLAGLKTTAGLLPVPFTLDDSLALLPDQPLSQQDNVTLVARISLSGGTEPMPGDLEGEIRSVAVGSQGITLVIDQVRP
jgi:cytochrome c-type biogenesis protein CcmH